MTGLFINCIFSIRVNLSEQHTGYGVVIRYHIPLSKFPPPPPSHPLFYHQVFTEVIFHLHIAIVYAMPCGKHLP